MKKISYFIFAVVCLFSCEKNEKQETENGQARGKIIALLAPCVGSGYIIDIERPITLGKSGFYPYNPNEVDLEPNPELPANLDESVYGFYYYDTYWGFTWKYDNAIRVPSFSKSQPEGRENFVFEIGKDITFDYRIRTAEDDSMFRFNVFCTLDKEPPAIPVYIVTKIY
jgi:hypothetical protein